jgi:cytochrome c peroxidase
MNINVKIVQISFLLAIIQGCSKPSVPQVATHSAGLDSMRVALGKRLFFEPRLSANGTTSCATCHDPKRAFTDGKARSVGLYGDQVPHNAPSLFNVQQMKSLNWATPGIRTLEQQMGVPLFGAEPPEMGMHIGDVSALEQLQKDPTYKKQFRGAFPQADAPDWTQVRQAIAAYERTLESRTSPYDRFVQGDSSALSVEARRGYNLFVEMGCPSCHQPPLFTNGSYHAIKDTMLHGAPIMVYTSGGVGEYYRVPSLRNLTFTAPYYHDGRAATLHIHATDASVAPLTARQNHLLKAFLMSLTDSLAVQKASN